MASSQPPGSSLHHQMHQTRPLPIHPTNPQPAPPWAGPWPGAARAEGQGSHGGGACLGSGTVAFSPQWQSEPSGPQSRPGSRQGHALPAFRLALTRPRPPLCLFSASARSAFPIFSRAPLIGSARRRAGFIPRKPLGASSNPPPSPAAGPQAWLGTAPPLSAVCHSGQGNGQAGLPRGCRAVLPLPRRNPQGSSLDTKPESRPGHVHPARTLPLRPCRGR